VGIASKAHHTPLAPKDNLTGGKGELETQDDPFGPGLYAHQCDARAGKGLQVVLEIFFFARVRPRDADGRGRARVVSHRRRLPAAGPGWRALRLQVSVHSQKQRSG
jgi:hypothetical protein